MPPRLTAQDLEQEPLILSLILYLVAAPDGRKLQLKFLPSPELGQGVT